MTTDVKEKKEKTGPGWGPSIHFRWAGSDYYLCGKKRVSPRPSKPSDVPCPICFTLAHDIEALFR